MSRIAGFKGEWPLESSDILSEGLVRGTAQESATTQVEVSFDAKFLIQGKAQFY